MGKILFTVHDGAHILKFEGDVRLSLGPTIASFLGQLKTCDHFKSMIVDLSDTDAIDSTALGLIAKVAICTKSSFNAVTTLISPKDGITRILKSMAMEQVCLLATNPVAHSDLQGMLELPQEVASEESLREQVIEAHRTLMSLHANNRIKFQDLVEALENEKTNHAGPKRLARAC